MTNAIECINIRRVFTSKTLLKKKREKVALENLSFTVKAGTVFGLLGPNGAGKTTTVRILSTLLTPTAGQAKVFSFDVVSQLSEVRKRIGLILGGDRGFYGPLNGIDNLKYFAAISHLDRSNVKKRIDEVIELVGLTAAGQQPVNQYSRGMKQRLHVARGLLTDPQLLFMDEPTIGIDPAGAKELRDLIPKLVERGKTILLTTHYMQEADQLCNQITLINEGRIVAEGTPSQIKKSFGKISIIEVIVKWGAVDTVQKLAGIEGVNRVELSSDGVVQRLTIQVIAGVEVKEKISAVFGNDNIESMISRDPTLEEAYLSIIQ